LAISLAERYFTPAMGKKRGEIPFCQGEMAESGKIWGETPRCVYFKVQHHNNI